MNTWVEDLRGERNGVRLSAEYDFMIIDKTCIDARGFVGTEPFPGEPGNLAGA